MSWQVRVQMAGYTRAAVSCTFSTTVFKTLETKCKHCWLRLLEIQVCGHNMSQTASLTCFILLPLRDILEPKKKSIRLALAMAWNFPLRNVSRSPKGEIVMLIVSTWWISSEGPQHKNKHDQWNSATNSCCFFHIQACKFLLKMQPMNWYEWVRCGSWRLQGSSPHKGRRHLANGMPRVRLDEKQHMNMTWLRTPQIFLAPAVPNAHKTFYILANASSKSGADSKTHSRSPWSWGSGFSLRDWPTRFVSKIPLISQPVDTRSLRSARRRIMGKFMIDIWSLQRFAWLSRLSTLSESIPPKSKSEIWHLGSTTPRAKLQFAW